MLKSYCFFHMGFHDGIWGLFEEWEKVSEPFAYSLEVIDAAASGRIDMEHFNLDAYNKTIRKNENKVENRRKNKVLHIMYDVSETVTEPYGVPESVVTEYAGQEDEYEKLEDEDEVLYAVREIRELDGVFRCEYRVDILHCIRQALKGLPESVRLLKKLVASDPFIGELIKIILESGQPFAELFPEAV